MPAWMKLQWFTPDADAFRSLLESPARTTLAGLFDIVVAASYGALGWIGLRHHGRGAPVSRIAAWAVVVGASFDQIENILVLRNVAAIETLTDGWVTAMRLPGALSFVAAPAILLLYGYLIRTWLERRRSVAVTAHSVQD